MYYWSTIRMIAVCRAVLTHYTNKLIEKWTSNASCNFWNISGNYAYWVHMLLKKPLLWNHIKSEQWKIVKLSAEKAVWSTWKEIKSSGKAYLKCKFALSAKSTHTQATLSSPYKEILYSLGTERVRAVMCKALTWIELWLRILKTEIQSPLFISRENRVNWLCAGD